MVKKVGLYVLSSIIGLVLGVGIFYLHEENAYENLGTNNGIWSTATTDKGESQMGINAVAVHSIFRQTAKQAISFNTVRDSNGDLLKYTNHYQVVGKQLPCRFWSISFYGGDDYLIPNERNIFSITDQNIVWEEDGSFIIDISEKRPPNAKNWVQTGKSQNGSDGIHPLLRLYTPSNELREKLSSYPLPKIIKINS
ncbi:DUF1214 domain-containing protein, partial [bacterium]|nr:DUF1214 domain-containing protein [bacterium]